GFLPRTSAVPADTNGRVGNHSNPRPAINPDSAGGTFGTLVREPTVFGTHDVSSPRPPTVGGGPRQRARVRAATRRLRDRDGPAPRAVEGARRRGHFSPASIAGRTKAGSHTRGATSRDEGPARAGGLTEREAHVHLA